LDCELALASSACPLVRFACPLRGSCLGCATGHKSVRPVFWVKRFSDFLGLGKLFTNLKIPSAFLKLER
jgi:hypothetical protein